MSRHARSALSEAAIAPARLRAAQLLLVGAALVDAYLAWVSISGGSIAGCGPASNCHTVLSSRWAYWFGVPVSVPALLVYATVFLATLWLDRGTPAAQQRNAWQVTIGGAVAILGAALWFIVLQVFVLRRICPFCMAAHTCGLLGTILLLTKAPLRPAPEKQRDLQREVFVPPQRAGLLGAGAVAALGVLVLGQAVHQPMTYVAEPIAAGLSTNSTAAAPRVFQLFDGKFQLDLSRVPLIGRAGAPHVMVSLFDYTCHHCREMHPHLLDAFHRFSNELAIISLPMPLDSKCNPIVKRTLPPHTNACAMARLGLTVWLADPKASPKYDDWVFAPSTPPPPAAAEEYARQLVGSEAFNRAATNAWVDQQIQQDVAIYETAYRLYRKGYMPEVIIGTNLISGTFTRDQLFRVLAEQFGLKSP